MLDCIFIPVLVKCDVKWQLSLGTWSLKTKIRDTTFDPIETLEKD